MGKQMKRAFLLVGSGAAPTGLRNDGAPARPVATRTRLPRHSVPVLAAVVLALGPTSLVAAQDRCEFRDVRELSAPGSGNLDVIAGAGTLVVTGRDGLGEVRVTATLCASTRERLEVLEVSLEGDRLKTDYPNRGRLWSGRNYARINLDVEVPVGTDVDVEDGSGSVSISGVSAVYVKDGSGKMTLRGVGSVVVEDGAGSLEIEGVTNDVVVEDGAGSLSIRRVTGDVMVEDSSGSLDIREVGGDVMVSDGSGSIEIQAVGGSVRMDRVGSGSVSVRDVEGNLVVTDGRRERIRYSNIRGSLELPPAKRRGGVR